MARVEPRLSHAVARAEHAIRSRLHAELSAYGLTITGYSVLHLLAEYPGATGTALAARTLVTRQAIAHLVIKLERAGLVERKRTPTGAARSIGFTLTIDGCRTLTAAEDRVNALEARLHRAFNPVQREALFAAATVAENLNRP